MKRARRALLALAIIAATLVVLFAIGSLVARPLLTGGISSVTFHQFQSIPDYDSSDYEITDESSLAELAELFAKHNAIPEVVSISSIGSDCPGGVSTYAVITFDSGRVAPLEISRCGEGEGIYGGFVDEATELFESWKDPRIST